jgi:hypothetical protein
MTATTVVLRATCVALPPQESFVTGTPTASPTNTPFPTGSVVPMEFATGYPIPNMESSGTPGYQQWDGRPGYDTYGSIPELRIVFIAAHNISRGMMITQDDIIPTYWPVSAIPVEAFYNLGFYNSGNTYASQDIPRYQPFLSSNIQTN